MGCIEWYWPNYAGVIDIRVDNMTFDELTKVFNSLEECYPNVEDFSWGPTYEFAKQRRQDALDILRTMIEEKKNGS